MNLRQIPNSVIAQVENMARKGCTYKQIREATRVSDGTIAKVKQGKITSNREMVDYIMPEEYSELKELLANKEEQIIELRKYIKELEIYKQQHIEWSERQKELEKVLHELDVSEYK